MLLCRNCADAYLVSPTVEEFRQLRDIKDQQTKDVALADLADSVDVEHGILEILDALANDKKRPVPDKNPPMMSGGSAIKFQMTTGVCRTE